MGHVCLSGDVPRFYYGTVVDPSSQYDCGGQTIEQKKTFLIDFKSYLVRSNGYTIAPNDHCFPESWTFEGSNCGLSWKELDRQEDNEQFHGGLLEAVFKIEDCEEAFIMLRVRMIQSHNPGVDPGCKLFLLMNQFEVFGSIQPTI